MVGSSAPGAGAQDETEQRLALGAEARAAIGTWSTAAQVLEILGAFQDRGLIDYLATPRPIANVAAFAELPATRMSDLLMVLETAGIVNLAGEQVALTPPFAELTREDARDSPADLISHALMMPRLMRATVDAAELAPLSGPDALAVAAESASRPTELIRQRVNALEDDIPEFMTVLRSGRFLDVGCGVAGFSLTMALLNPELRVVALELVGDVAEEARRRADALGVADRVDVQCVSAPEYTASNTFDACLWAQPYFPESVRPATLAMIRGALHPGGVLMMQEMETEPTDADDRIAFALRRVVYKGWGVPFARRAEELAAEAEAASFQLIRIAQTPIGRMVLLKK